MEEPVWISHIQEIVLEDHWVNVTDKMGRHYRLDPEAALSIGTWVAEHREAVAHAQIALVHARHREEMALYADLLHPNNAEAETALNPQSRQPPPSPARPPRKPRRSSSTWKKDPKS